jgi:NitT/TauT family transport system substrate-binding protein
MPFRPAFRHSLWKSYPVRLAVGALAWLLLIAQLHYGLNGEQDERPVVKMGYMPVITNLAAPLLDHVSLDHHSRIRFKAVKFSSFAEMAEALRGNDIQAAFIIAPLSIVLRQQGEDVKVVYIGNRHESTFVVRNSIASRDFRDLAGRTIAVPMRYSGHNLGLLKAVSDAGMQGQVRVVEMNPPDMASALSTGALDGYFVGEPFAAQTLKNGESKLFYHAENQWPGFICNVLLVHQRFVEKDTAAVQYMVEGAIRSGLWARKHPDQAAVIASRYWGQPVELVRYALTTPPGRIVYDRFVPKEGEMAEIAELMVLFDLLKTADVSGLVEDRFALQSNLSKVDSVESILGGMREQAMVK